MENIPEYLRLIDLAEAAGVYSATIEKYLYRGLIVADATVQHGRIQAPIFLAEKLAEHLKAIGNYRKGARVNPRRVSTELAECPELGSKAPREIDAPWL